MFLPPLVTGYFFIFTHASENFERLLKCVEHYSVFLIFMDTRRYEFRLGQLSFLPPTYVVNPARPPARRPPARPRRPPPPEKTWRTPHPRPPGQPRGYPMEKTGGTPYPTPPGRTRTRGTPHPPDRLRFGRYASCRHAGGLSCFPIKNFILTLTILSIDLNDTIKLSIRSL